MGVNPSNKTNKQTKNCRLKKNSVENIKIENKNSHQMTSKIYGKIPIIITRGW